MNLFENSPSVNNLQWLSSQIDLEKSSNNKEEELRESNEKNLQASEIVSNTIDSQSKTDILDECKLVLNDLVTVVEETIKTETVRNECENTLKDIVGQVVAITQASLTEENHLKKNSFEGRHIFIFLVKYYLMFWNSLFSNY